MASRTVSGAVFVMVYRHYALITIAISIVFSKLWGGSMNQSMGYDMNELLVNSVLRCTDTTKLG